MSPKINELIRDRRTIHQFQAGRLPDAEIIRQAVKTACWAPNHHLTEPWQFYLPGPKTVEKIVELNTKIVRDKQGEKASSIKKERWSNVPGWLVLSCKKSADEIRYREDYAACCCAAQNMMLTLWDEGIGVKWTTGDIIRDHNFYDIIGMDIKLENVVGLFWYGYAEKIPATSRKPADNIIKVLP